jgi:transcription elongation GreA/GreB family factor
VAERIKEAREFGDISENAEYDDAKNEQAMLEKQISDLEEKLRNARVIDSKSVDTDVVSVGVTVHVKDQKTDKSTKFKIVGSAEATRPTAALERVARRPRPARPQARRDGQRAGAARARRAS